MITLTSSDDELIDEEIQIINEVNSNSNFHLKRTFTFKDEKKFDELNNQYYLMPENVLRIVYFKSSTKKLFTLPKELDQIDGKIYLKVKSIKAEELLLHESLPEFFNNKKDSSKEILNNNQEENYFYINHENDFTKPWIKARFIKISNDNYLFEDCENKIKYLVKSFSLASIYPPKEILVKPYRVVAKIKNKNDNNFILYSGTIAEFPKSLNKSRYLIFLENGLISYVEQENIFKIKEQSKNYSYFTPSFKPFIEYYYKHFPEIPLIKYKIGDKERINYKSFLNYQENETIEWVVGEVIEVDCNLIKFNLKYYNCDIWIYRGDNIRIYSLTNPKEGKFFSPNRRPLRNLETNIHKTPQIEHENNDVLVIKISDNEEEQDKIEQQLIENRVSDIKYINFSCKNLYKEELFFIYKTLFDKPKELFHAHSCDENCSKTNLKLKNFRGISMYLVPILLGWRRFYEKNIDFSKTISYLSPCGKIFYSYNQIYNYLIKTNSSVQIDQFCLDENFCLDSLENYEEKCFYINEDISENQEMQPVSIINSINRIKLNSNFKYIAEREFQNNINISFNKNFIVCCDCEDDCNDLTKCQCQHLTIEGYKNIHSFSQFPLSYRKLNDKILSGYYECNINCKCNISCVNRIVQLGTRNLLQVFRTFKKGWGVRSLNDIPKGAFVCKYSGVILDDETANKEGEEFGDQFLADLDLIENCEDAKIYFEELTLFTNSDNIKSESIRNFYGKPYMYAINGKLKGNVGRFINHSCNPNLFVQNVFINTHDLRFPCVAFFAKKFIPAFVELTWDYNYQIDTSKKKIYCKCESDNCRIRLI